MEKSLFGPFSQKLTKISALLAKSKNFEDTHIQFSKSKSYRFYLP